MARAYSLDLRKRVMAAVMAAGLSWRQAVARSGVGVSTTIKRFDRCRVTGNTAPGKLGDHQPKTIAGGHADWLRRRCRERAFTQRGLVSELAGERALKADFRAVRALVHAEKQSYKKSRWSPVTTITATSSSSTISAVTRPRQCAAPSEPAGQR